MGEIYRASNSNNFFKQVRLSKNALDLSKRDQDFELPELLRSSPVALNVPASMLKERSLSPKNFVVGASVFADDDPISFEAIEPKAKNNNKTGPFVDSIKKDLVETIDPKPVVETQQEKFSHRVIDADSSVKSKEVGLDINSINAPKAKEFSVFDISTDLDDFDKENLDLEAVKSFQDYQEQRREGAKNEERRELPRSHVRGVGYPQPAKMKFGAFITLCLLATFPLSVLLLGSVLFGAPIWVLAGLGVAAFFFFFYLSVASSCRCRVCGQGQFAVKRCRRHKKAHHVAGLGYIIPTSIHMLLFNWFRCIYCGTAISLKKDKE